MLENQGAAKFLGEPALDINDFMRLDRDGRGYINVLSAGKLMQNPRPYITFSLVAVVGDVRAVAMRH